jgi:hypothetical protein
MNSNPGQNTSPTQGVRNQNGGYSGTGQTQPLAGQDANSLNTNVDKGGMRGVGLLAATIAEYELKKKATDLAKDYYNVNRIDYQFFQNVHQPNIAVSASQVFDNTYNPQYAYDFYASVPAAIAKVNNVDKQWFEARRRIPKYSLGQQRRLDYDMSVARAHAVTAGWNAGIRYELSWVDDHNNRAFNRKAAVVNIGIGVGNVVREGLANSVTSLATSYDVMGDTVASIGNGYAAYSGANDGRSEVRRVVNGSNQ